ncbi:MAG: ATP-binding protein [Christensenellales bacterium]|jgi:DNA polymerase III delta' subunit
MMKMKTHAVILSGDHTAGQNYAKNLIAERLCGGAAAPCGTCPVCRRVMTLRHPDVHLIAPQGTSIGVDAIRSLIAEAAVRPFEAAEKAFIIAAAGAMTVQAQNALLKTLEEPPANTTFYLVTDAPQKLLATITSRCQHVRVPAMTDEEIIERLREDGVGAQNAAYAAYFGGGSLEKARELSRSENFFLNGEEALDALADALQGDYQDVQKLSSLIGPGRDSARAAALWWQAALFQIYRWQSGDASYAFEMPGALTRAGEKMGAGGAHRLLSELQLFFRRLDSNVVVALAADGWLNTLLKEKDRWQR